MKLTLLVFWGILTASMLFAQPVGSIEGRVIDLSKNEGLAGANIAVVKEKKGAATDIDGFLNHQSAGRNI
jgi:hypothetical protein